MTRAPVVLAVCTALLAGPSIARGELPVPELRGPVVDLSGALDAGSAAELDVTARSAWNGGAGPQLQFLVVRTLGGESIERFALRVADAWRIGAKGRDDGVLVVVSVDDRKIRIEVGGGLEGTLTDRQCSRIIREVVAPEFRERRYGRGLVAAAREILAALRAGAAASPVPAPGGPMLDLAGVVDAASSALVAECVSDVWNGGDGLPLRFLVVPALRGEPVESLARRALEAWKLGDDGILVAVAVEEGQTAIEVGAALERTLTPQRRAWIVRKWLQPALQERRHGPGLVAVAKEIRGTLASMGRPVRVPEPPPLTAKWVLGTAGIVWGIPIALVVLVVLLRRAFESPEQRARRKRESARGWRIARSSGSGSSSSFGSSSSSSDSSSDRSWSGGGGGFSGGGASGSW